MKNRIKPEHLRVAAELVFDITILAVVLWAMHDYLESGYRDGACPIVQTREHCEENVARARREAREEK